MVRAVAPRQLSGIAPPSFENAAFRGDKKNSCPDEIHPRTVLNAPTLPRHPNQITYMARKGTEGLTTEVRQTRWIALGVTALALLAYFGQFWLHLGRSASPDPEQWGQFGDYIGGILNPVIALLAFYWLTRSVLLQKEEMQRTADALQDASMHQAHMAAHAERAARINALAALLASAEASVASLRTRIMGFDQDMVTHGKSATEHGELVTGRQATQYRHDLAGRLYDRMAERDKVADTLQKMLSE